VIGGAVAISTVSEPWAETYRRRYSKPVTTVYTGFDPALIGDDAAPGADPDSAEGRPGRDATEQHRGRSAALGAACPG
jgi:hypothetical protein